MADQLTPPPKTPCCLCGKPLGSPYRHRDTKFGTAHDTCPRGIDVTRRRRVGVLGEEPNQ